MTIRTDSYSSTGEVLAFTRHLLDGQAQFNSTTRPTVGEVERFIDRCSGVLNIALRQGGFATPITNSTAALACADWVTTRGAEYVEITQRGTGYSDKEGSRVSAFRNLQKSAVEFVAMNSLGFKLLGVLVLQPLSQGLRFTGQTLQANRADPQDNTLQQPFSEIDQFDNQRTG